jgi:general secretion pathway protein B
MAGYGPEGNSVMSYILDALKKLEHEKTRKAIRSGAINIAGRLFEDDRPRPAPLGIRKTALAVTAAVLVTFGATWLFLRGAKVGEIRDSSPSTKLSPDLPAPSPAPVPPSEPLRIDAQPSFATPSAAPLPKTLPPRPAPSQPRQLTRQQDAAPAVAAVQDSTIQELRKPVKEPAGSTLPADQFMAAPADIKLSGIAWQDDRRERRAVVNGFLMQEGGVVSGARITDIFQDRVRFSLSGRVFEIPLISSGVPAAAK